METKLISSTSRPYLPALTTLRFVTVLYVFLFHLEASKIYYSPQLADPGGSIGYVGVNWFFVLSGFILTYSYAGKDKTPSEIWRARFVRIYPVYFVSLCFTAPLFFYVCFNLPVSQESAWIIPIKENIVSFTFLTFLLLQSWVPAAALSINLVSWSLSVEAFFYLLFPLILPHFLRLTSVQIALIMAVSACASILFAFTYLILSPDGISPVAYNLNHLTWLNVLRFNPLLRLPEFVIGICGGIFFIRHQLSSRFATALIGFSLFTLAIVVYQSQHIAYPLLHNGLLSIPFMALIYGVALRPGWISFLEWKPLHLLGELSFSFFLIHAVIIAVFFRPDGIHAQQRSLFEIIVCLITAIAVSFLLNRFIEEPARKRLAKS